jgi:hypothetical protein
MAGDIFLFVYNMIQILQVLAKQLQQAAWLVVWNS